MISPSTSAPSEADQLHHPHLSLIRFENEEIASKTLSQLNWAIDTFTCAQLGIFEMGSHGTCTNLIKSYTSLPPFKVTP